MRRLLEDASYSAAPAWLPLLAPLPAGAPAQPPAQPPGPSASFNNGGPNAMGLAISRAVLFFGVAAVAVIWCSALYCMMRAWFKRRQRSVEQAAALAAAHPPGTPPGTLKSVPVLIVGPQGFMELGVMEGCSDDCSKEEAPQEVVQVPWLVIADSTAGSLK